MTQLFSETMKYSQQTLEQARRIIPGNKGIGLNCWLIVIKIISKTQTCLCKYFTGWAEEVGGDDNIHDPLQFIYKTRQKEGYLTQVFTLTDGYVQTGYVSDCIIFSWQGNEI